MVRRIALAALMVLVLSSSSPAQTLAALEGDVRDASGSLLPGAAITVRDESKGFTFDALTDDEGRYHVAAIPGGVYRVTVEAEGFRPELIERLTFDVGRTLVRDFQLELGPQRETVVVGAEAPLIDRVTTTVSHAVTAATVQEIPLNGRHFIDLGLLVPGAVAPSQTGFSTTPMRGVGAFAVNIAGNREEAVAYVVNGATMNNLTFGSLTYEPPLVSLGEVRIDRAPFSPEYGHVSGAVIHVVTRSGTDQFHGEGFTFARDDALDARNFFEFTTAEPHPFTRRQFGGALGGPIRRERTFFFAAYEGVRQRQGVDMNSLVLSDEQRSAASDPGIRSLIPLIPRANFFDADGTPRFVGSAPAIVDIDRWTIDLRHAVGNSDRVEGFFGTQAVRTVEPASQGNSIPGFGHVAKPFKNLLTVNHTHVSGSALLNEARFGRTRLNGGTFPATPLNPADFGIRNGVTQPIGLPQFIVAGALNFGGPGSLPQGRYDTLYVFSDTFTRASGRHTTSVGGEYRHFINENFAEGTGVFNFPDVAAFLAGTANSFSITLGRRTSVIDQRAVSLFFYDRVRVGGGVSLELGARYEWHVTPAERDDRFIVFDPQRASLVRVGVDVDEVYRQNRNVEPRLGIAWDISGRGRTVVRAAYGRTVDQPSTTAVRDTTGNPPFGIPVTAAGSIPLGRAIDVTRPVGLAPTTVDRALRNALLDSWNVNVQRQISATTAATIGYLGSRGANLRISRNINQPVNGVRPFLTLAASSPLFPGTPLGNIVQVESSGFSSYQGAWLSLSKRFSRELQFDTSYTWSKSLDTNSLNSSGFAIQNSNDIANQYGLSDFDARHRFVLNAIYTLPSAGHVLIRGWQVAVVVQAQSGNPVNIVTSNSALNGLPNTVRPDVTGPIRIVGDVDRWFDPSVFAAVDRFGNLGRNAVIGPSFHDTDLSIIRNVAFDAGAVLQWRVDIFNLFNTVNFGPPGNVVGTPTFGKITRTRLPTGDAGSSRQIQLGVRLSF
jgi:hypothetical protein